MFRDSRRWIGYVEVTKSKLTMGIGPLSDGVGKRSA